MYIYNSLFYTKFVGSELYSLIFRLADIQIDLGLNLRSNNNTKMNTMTVRTVPLLTLVKK